MATTFVSHSPFKSFATLRKPRLPRRVVVVVSGSVNGLRNLQSTNLDRRALLAASVAFVAGSGLTTGDAQAKNIEQAKREKEARKRAVRRQAEQSRKDGLAVESDLTSDYTLPEGTQRGRNSRTIPGQLSSY